MAEMLELLDLLEGRAGHITHPLNVAIPLSVHARHTLTEILAAVGRSKPGQFYQHREGTYYEQATNSDLFFVTLEKSERDYSPSTLYKDYAISPDLFHWESQSTTGSKSKTGQRYIHHRALGGHILLFVRQRRIQNGQRCRTRFLGQPTTFRTSRIDQFSSSGSYNVQCRLISSGGPRSRQRNSHGAAIVATLRRASTIVPAASRSLARAATHERVELHLEDPLSIAAGAAYFLVALAAF